MREVGILHRKGMGWKNVQEVKEELRLANPREQEGHGRQREQHAGRPERQSMLTGNKSAGNNKKQAS